jgi:hypothetical protein
MSEKADTLVDERLSGVERSLSALTTMVNHLGDDNDPAEIRWINGQIEGLKKEAVTNTKLTSELDKLAESVAGVISDFHNRARARTDKKLADIGADIPELVKTNVATATKSHLAGLTTELHHMDSVVKSTIDHAADYIIREARNFSRGC